tara:strand:- start:1651 stop:1929 length:279 start_codon:yes stop_codon:yes gene_type:complete
MVIEEELSFQKNRITQLQLYYEILCIKIYYEKYKVCENDYLSNENDLNVFKAQTQLNKIEETLNYLKIEFQTTMEYYIDIKNKEYEQEINRG